MKDKYMITVVAGALVLGVQALSVQVNDAKAYENVDAATIIEEDIEYGPEVLTVHVDQPIRIHNKDPFEHKSRITLQKESGGLGEVALKDHTEKPGTKFTFALNNPGTYQIRCMLHDGMTATIKAVE